ncbi:MAG: carboxylate--amine ligase [bacterium]|nr:carboxylate--amine ligase [bacterium]
MDFEILILGSDINAYYMARCYHEQYNKKAYLIGKAPMNFTNLSKILNIKMEPKLQEKETFKKVLKQFYLEHKDKKILLVGSNDTYVRLIIENQEYLSKYFVFHRYSEDLLNTLLVKEKFSLEFEGVDKPETYVYNISDKFDMNFIKKVGYPLILKPSDGIKYHDHEFSNQFKVYKIKNETELFDVIEKIKESGYDGNLIIQKFIKGDDSYLFDCICYVDRLGKVRLMTFATIGLQEHTPTGIGNATVVLNGYNRYNNTEEITKKLKSAIEKSGYKGFCEFDLKYDIDDNKFKVLEINPRQARCSYYLTFAGYNIVKYLVDDLILEKDLKYHFVDDMVCLSFVPKYVIKKYVKDKDMVNTILKLYNEDKVVDPLHYKKDNGIKRRLWLFVRSYNYRRKYKNLRW